MMHSSTHPTFLTTGHVDGFSDPMVDCKKTKLRFRADQLHYSPVILKETGERIGYICVVEGSDTDMMQDAKRQVKALLKSTNHQKGAEIQEYHFQVLTQATPNEMSQIPSPASGEPTLTMPRDFNLMFETKVGAVATTTDDDDPNTNTTTAYLRPETAQGIFTNFKNVLATSRQKIPFGIAQIGKAFRNEITPRNFIFRSREFEQMEVEYFIEPKEDVWKTYQQEWIDSSKAFLLSIGVRDDLMGWDIHEKDDLAHYARACTDITFQFPFGEKELMGIAARGNYDLTQHAKGSGKCTCRIYMYIYIPWRNMEEKEWTFFSFSDTFVVVVVAALPPHFYFSKSALEYYDEQTKERYVPHVIEPSLGVDRLLLAILCSAYTQDTVGGEARTLLKFHPKVAPIKAAIFPLVKNNDELVGTARSLFRKLQKRYNVQWDVSGAIGRRYRRADEVGVPFCITVDFETMETDGANFGTVTVRDRDTTEQVRMPMENVLAYLSQQIDE